MNEYDLDQNGMLAPSNRYLPLILILFFGSGCAALIYEIVWFQLLELVIGSSAVSLGVLLGTYMGGMCLGSLAFPRIVSGKRHPLRTYALIELGIGLVGIAVLFGVPHIDKFYTEIVGKGYSSVFMRGIVCAICLLPPTFLMGATLPAIARWVETNPKGVSWLGFFYGGNIAGAVFGCLLAGFYLLRVHDMAIATYVAFAINLTVSAFGLILSKNTAYSMSEPELHHTTCINNSRPWSVYLAIAISGLTALGAEVVWTRLLSLMMGATVYTFSIILAVFLIGLGIGSSLGSLILRNKINPRIALGFCQLFLIASVAYTAYMVANSLPFWPIDPTLSSSPWLNFQLDLMRCLWAVLPGSLFWGASFPLALGAAASEGQDPGKLVGGIYAANTVGAIIGSVGFSMIVIPKLGTQQAQRLLIALSSLSCLLMFLPPLWIEKENVSSISSKNIVKYRTAFVIVFLVVFGFTGLFANSVNKVPWGLIAEGRYLPTYNQNLECKYVGEGMNSSIAVTEMPDGTRNFHVSGKIVASSDPLDMKLQLMLGHIPALLNKNPKKILVVGCGAGVTAGSFVNYPSVEKIVICEIEPLIPGVANTYFGEYNNHVKEDNRVEVVYDDARHYILTTDEKFDIITSDPIHPWVKGAAALYTEEYFKLCRKHLNPGGIITEWVPLYESTLEAVKSEIATCYKVFPNITIWSNDDNGQGYDIVMLGQAEDTNINVDELQDKLDNADYASVRESLASIGFRSAVNLLSTYAGQGCDLQDWLKDAVINKDRNLKLQYLAGMGLNLYHEDNIFKDMLAYRKYPKDLFVASDQYKQELIRKLE